MRSLVTGANRLGGCRLSEDGSRWSVPIAQELPERMGIGTKLSIGPFDVPFGWNTPSACLRGALPDEIDDAGLGNTRRVLDLDLGVAQHLNVDGPAKVAIDDMGSGSSGVAG